ncbi:PREDICTED: putative F-box protein At3g52320 isoform X2 [Ipomoea nil]|uniref:putative F-box protein At3g52320 isoform X1 n=1 Tax=Ipomoea nil TaxID=35883 RepID=UPI000900E862|nr:PREDICTED: putative F-box protein At3g52320 isoform X1 [Ipomoea nil]XP_019170783.1 PREDICTED: putative F-box protein At3g52320 isoform X2 [Ipomoea nil]XP_019170784.1 PREDICTED: putative F-box protein At3g52320 isoform X2 [Ipomoea nil]
MENCKLSTDQVVDILSRLPVKSLMRFKCVCKFFYDLITSDHHFMDTHYEISKTKTDCVLLEAGWAVREYYLLYKESSEYNEIGCIYLDIPTTPRAMWVKCCKGMLCLISTRNDITELDHGDYLIYDIWICNPSIRKVKALPSVTVPYRPPYNAFVLNEFGFGISNDMTWKVVMLVQFCSVDDFRTTHEMTLVYSQVGGDSWSLRQINPVTWCRDIEGQINDFYLKGRYYWWADRYARFLIWFDMNDEVFGTIELPLDVSIDSISIMNETIALLGYSSVEDSSCIEIWLMIENDNNTYWHKQASIDCAVNLDNIESLTPIGIWNVDGELLVSLDKTVEWDSDDSDSQHPERVVPYFISLDLVTQERKMFPVSKQRKSITMASNPTAGDFQVYNERNIDITEEWEPNIFIGDTYARVYDESLHFL